MPTTSNFAKFLNPKSIAVIGASRSPDKVGYQVLHNLIEANFKGKLYPINPNAQTILKLKTYPTVSAVKQPIDLGIIVTPAPLVSSIIAECHQSKITNAIIISSGFAESGIKGATLQQELYHTLIQYPVSVLGPNCLGVLSPTFQLNAAFGPSLPEAGKVMLISQSGALVTGIIDWAKMMNIGISHAISFGNRINTGEIEALEYAANDRKTEIILLYLESFANAPKLFSLCSQITPRKPIIFLKGGQSLAGQSASASHTAALASNYALTKAFATQTGVIVTDTISSWLNLAAAFVHVPKTSRNHLTIITNAGGPGVLSTDEASGLGLSTPELPLSLKRKLETALPRITAHNPIDILGDASPENVSTALSILKKDSSIGSLLTIITPQSTTKPLETAQAIVDTKIHHKIPIYAVFIGGEKMAKPKQLLRRNQLLTFDFPTEALEIIAAKSRYETTLNQIPLYPARKLNFIGKSDQNRLAKQLASPLTLDVAFHLLDKYQLTLPKSAIINAIDEVGESLDFVGKPAVIKTAGLGIAHKAVVGGVSLNVMTATQARLIFRRLQTLHSQVLFQQTILGELELIIGTKRDAQMGPFITFGLGGGLTNTIADRGYVFIPAAKAAIVNMVKTTKAYAAIQKKKLPIEPVIDALTKVATILTDFPEIDELEINPAILTKKRLYCADIKITPVPTIKTA